MSSSVVPLGCVIAGGRSSRMGRDKASLVLGGETLLRRATRALSTVCRTVAVVGTGVTASTECRVLQDRVPDRGPLGGVVTALHFAQENSLDQVMFLPVDMPLLPASLLRVLSQRWTRDLEQGAWVCCAQTAGIVQPLICLVHVKTIAMLEERLDAGDLRVRPGLAVAAEHLASAHPLPCNGFEVTCVDAQRMDQISPKGWEPTVFEWELQAYWYRNVNTPEDFQVVEHALRRLAHRTTQR